MGSFASYQFVYYSLLRPSVWKGSVVERLKRLPKSVKTKQIKIGRLEAFWKMLIIRIH